MKNAKLPVFKRGQVVTWTSQASGFKKKKTGNIVEIVKPDSWMTLRSRKQFGERPIGGKRTHRSYIVNVNGKLYWPLVKYLKLKA